MAVDIERDSDRRMAEALLDNLAVNTGLQHSGRVRVPQIMQADARQAMPGEEQFKGVGQASRLIGVAVRLRHHKTVLREPDAELQESFGLPRAVLTQFLNYRGCNATVRPLPLLGGL